ncbi:hypothetical protein PLCT2_02579 [Planctomycetaceae bacterium]|nr:hypothetical protein PLCT2_02579 [Planctomycetaceae bacterium]
MLTMKQFLSWEASTRDIIDFKRIYVDMANGDLLAGLMLSEIVYWHLPNKEGLSRMKVVKEGRQWIAVRHYEWWDRARMTPDQARRALSTLCNLGILEKKVFKFYGETTTHVRIIEKRFMSLWEAALALPAKNPYRPNQDSSTIPSRNGVQTIREWGATTIPVTETTTETTTYSAEPEKTLSGETAPQALDREENAAEDTSFTVEIDTLAQHEGFLKYNAKTKAKARFRCPQCGDNNTISHSDEKTPCCGATIIWRNNPLWDKHQRQKAADEEAKERNRQKSDDPAVRYLETAVDAKVTPNEVREIQNFVTRNGLPRFMALVDDSKAKATDEGKWGRGIIAIVVKRLSHWGNGKSAEKKSTSEPIEQAVNLPKGTVMTIRPEALAKLKELGIE